MIKTVRNWIAGIAMLASFLCNGQGGPLTPWFLGGNTVLSNLWYLGCDAASDQDLRLKTTLDYQIQMHTSDIERFRLLPDNTYTALGAYSGITADGYSLHSPDVAAFYTGGAPGPYSLEHLAAATDNAFQDAFRDWAKTGTTYTGGKTMGYVGLKGGDEGQADLVMQLAKREGETAPDRIRFLFTDKLTGGTGATSQEGLEGMRLTAVGNDDVNVGIGDYGVSGGEPTERLDVLKGKVRVRSLPTDAVSVSDEMVTVNMTNGVLEHRPFPTGGANCEWYSNAAPASKFVLSGTAAPSAGSCPDRAWLYGIGIPTPLFKFDVYHNDNDRLIMGGINSNYVVNNPAATITGMQSKVTGSYYALGYGLKTLVSGAALGIGVEGAVGVNSASIVSGTAYGVSGGVNHTAGTLSLGCALRGVAQTKTTASNVYGSYGEAYGYGSANVTSMYGASGQMQLLSGTVAQGFGVRGLSYTGAATITNNYGVHGFAHGGVNNYSVYGQLAYGGTVNWSGFFVGPISASGMSFPSDGNLKTEVQDLPDPMGLLMQLQPKSYTYRREDFPQMGLPEGLRYGFIAQEVQQVFPQFVTQSHQPQELDSLGNEISAAVDYLALSTSDIIPILVGAVQEQQQVQIDALAAQTAEMDEMRDELQAQQTRLDQLEQLLTDCCNRSGGDGLRQGGASNTLNMNVTEGDRTLRIVPNPMQDQATIYYQLERSGRMQLLVNSNDGKELRVLKEANTEAGTYQYAWATDGLSPGVYYVTLLLDGQPITKQVIKIDR